MQPSDTSGTVDRVRGHDHTGPERAQPEPLDVVRQERDHREVERRVDEHQDADGERDATGSLHASQATGIAPARGAGRLGRRRGP